MDFALTSEQRLMVDAAKRMVEKDIQPILDRHDPDRPLPKSAALQILAKCAELGITGARIPQSGGGAGMRVLDYGLISEQLPPIAALIVQPHEATAARLYFSSTPEQRERFLPDLIAGRKITGTAATEPDVGSDSRAVKTRVVEHDDSLLVNGRKMWISNATISDVLTVICRMQDGEARRNLVRILVDREVSPYETREIDVIGLRQSHLGEVVFNDCRVPKENLFGRAGDAARILTLTWLANRPLLGLCATHMAQQAFDAARAYAGVRKQFGRLIGGFQLIQQDLAEIETAITTSRLLCYNALDAIDRGERANGLSAMAKRYAIDACDRAIAIAMRVHGAMGLSRELGIERLARDVRMLAIPDGTLEILTLIQGREITGIDNFRIQ